MSAMTLPPVNPAPIPTQLVAPPAPAAGGAPGPGSFSQLLEAADARRQAEAPAPSPENKAQNQTQNNANGNRPATAAPKAPSREDRKTDPKTERSNGAAATDDNTAERSTAGVEAPGEGADAATAPADAASLLAGLGLMQRVLAPSESGGRAGRGGLGRQALDGSADAAQGRTGATAGAAGAIAAQDLKATDTTERGGASKAFAELLAAAQGADAATDTAAVTALAEPQLATQPEVRPADATTLGSLVGHGAAPGSPATGSSAAHPAEARLGTTPGQAGFAEQLGAQLSTFVREGVQHARLQLHPLELGPVTVQIQLDGGSAHMSFAAEHAQTRQALEQALPTLAGSLREAGLTLSGGGVFEQPQQPQPQADGGRGDGRGTHTGRGGKGSSDDGGPLQAAASPALRRRGVVDLVA